MTEFEQCSNFDGNNLVFLVGCPRSGTTWLQRLLASHPLIRSGPEADIFTAYLGPSIRAFKSDATWTRAKGLACYLSEDEFIRIQKSYAMELFRPLLAELQPGQFFLEKTPGHALFITEILLIFPRAKIIHLVRDPRDTSASLIAASGSWGKAWAPSTIGEAGQMWRAHVLTASRAGRKLPASAFLEVRYEDLHSVPVSVLSRCSEFLGLDWDCADIQHALEINSLTKLRNGRGTSLYVRAGSALQDRDKVVEPRGFVRNGKVGGWRTELSLSEKLRLWREIRGDLAEAGYDWHEFKYLDRITTGIKNLRTMLRGFTSSTRCDSQRENSKLSSEDLLSCDRDSRTH